MGCCDGTPLTSANFEQLSDVMSRQGIEHNWQRDGWAPFDAVTITADGAQSFAQSVVNGRGVLTAGAAALGGLRVAYLRENTSWSDSEIQSVVYGPTTDWLTNNAQQGHIHRVRQISANVWEGIAIWTSVVFGGDYSWLHCAAVRWDGITLSQAAVAGGTFDATDAGYIDRRVRIFAHQRFNFGSWFNEYHLMHPQRLSHMESGDRVAIANMADGTFNETNIALFGAVEQMNSYARVTEPTTLSAVAYTQDVAGDITPTGVDLQKRWTPFVLATRVVGGSAASVTVEGKRWRVGEPEPDWGDPRVRRGTITAGGGVPEIATGPGHCALWGAHFYSSSAGAWGDAKFRCVSASGCP